MIFKAFEVFILPNFYPIQHNIVTFKHYCNQFKGIKKYPQSLKL
nr:MAG TPA: hypothetical protein [Caudoviricetes sp.]